MNHPLEALLCDMLGEPLFVTRLKDSSVANRPRLMHALRKLVRQAGDDLHLCEEYGVHIFAPSAGSLGMFCPDVDAGPEIFLSPGLDFVSQAQADYTVAHEFAHAICHYRGEGQPVPCICGKGDECDCIDCDCQGCKEDELDWLPDSPDFKTASEYVNTPAEFAADSLVLSWGYKLPAWKQKLRKVTHGR